MTTLSPAQLKLVALTAGFTGSALTDAVATAMAASGGNDAYSAGGRIGLWALAPGTGGYSATWLGVPNVNALAAHSVWSADGGQFSPAHWPQWANGSAQQWVTKLNASSSNWGSTAPTPDTSSSSWDAVVSGVEAAANDNPVSQAASAAGGALSGVDAIAKDADKTAAWVSTPSNWLHIGYVIGGGALLLVGLYVVARPAVNGAASTVTKVATGATPLGRAAKAVGGRRAKAAAGRAAAGRKAAAEGERRATSARRQARIEERHTWARAREQRAAERHAKKPKKGEESSSDD